MIWNIFVSFASNHTFTEQSKILGKSLTNRSNKRRHKGESCGISEFTLKSLEL